MTKEEQQALSQILIHVGETRKGIENLETGLEKIEGRLIELNSSAVKKAECTQRHVAVAQGITGLKEELRADIKAVKEDVGKDLKEIKQDLRFVRHKTGQEHPAITPEMLGPGSSGSHPIPSAVLALDEQGRQGKGRNWLGIIGGGIALLTFVGGIGLGLMHLGRKWEQMEQALELSRKQQVEAVRRQEAAAKSLQQSARQMTPPAIGPLVSPDLRTDLPKKPKKRRRAPHP